MMISGALDQMRIMNSLIRLKCYLALLISSTFNLCGQSVDGSAYNVFGMGTLYQNGLIPFQTMGYTGIGARFTDIVNLENPAGLNSVTLTNNAFNVGMELSFLNQSSGPESFNSTSGSLSDLSYWFKTGKNTAFSFGLSRYSNATYDIIDVQTTFDSFGASDSRNIGEGGTSVIYFAMGHELFQNFHVGIKADILLSSINRTEYVSFGQFAADLVAENKASFSKAILNFGIQYNIKLSNSNSLVIGSKFRHGANTIVSHQNSIVNDGTTSDTLITEDVSSLYIPRNFGFGASLDLGTWVISADYEFEDWSDNDEMTGFQYANRTIVSFGGQYQKNRFGFNFLERIAFRFGGGISSNYVIVENTHFSNHYYTLGLGLPISPGNTINLSYQHAVNGSKINSLIMERFSTFSLGVTIGDIWFRKRVYD